MTIDEIFASMPEEDAATGRDYLVIDPAARSITVPASERIFGVEGDEDAARKYFICPRYVGDNLDLAGMFLTVYWRNAGGDEDGYMVEDVQTKGEYVTFSWLLSEKAVAYKGAVQFAVCADLPNTAAKRRPDWNTTLAEGEVLEGMDPDLGDLETGSSDVLTQLREMVTAQTAAVEATGASQVAEVKAQGTNTTQEAVAAIQAQGAATNASIPADYTTLAGKVNEQANAIKGHLAAQIIRADDVSPVEHFLGVKVQSKNLLNLDAGLNACLVKNADGTYTIQKIDGDWFSEKIPIKASAGDKITARVRGIGADGHAFLYVQVNFVDGTSKGMSFDNETDTRSISCPADTKNARVYIPPDGEEGAYKRFESIQLELGTEATEYTPYIDPATVTVTRCGKNLVSDMGATFEGTGIEWTVNDDGTVFANGTAETRCVCNFKVHNYDGSLVGKTVTLSGCPAGGAIETYAVTQRNYGQFDVGAGRTFTIENNNYSAWGIVINAGVKANNLVFKPQLELGDAATAYEHYKGATAMPDESGTVEGLPSAAPTMTLYTDTAGVTVECEYNRDSNAVYAELLAKIAALSGTT